MCLLPHPYVVTVCNFSTCPLTSPLVLPASQPHPPCCLTHLESQPQLICSQPVLRLPLAHSFCARLFFAFMTNFPTYLLGQISRLRPRFVLTSPPPVLRLLFPTTIFACVLPDSWLPVSISATLQEAPAKTLVGFFSLITPPRSPGLFWIIDSLSWFSC